VILADKIEEAKVQLFKEVFLEATDQICEILDVKWGLFEDYSEEQTDLIRLDALP
jgi:hypothetical protein